MLTASTNQRKPGGTNSPKGTRWCLLYGTAVMLPSATTELW
jgi:hypothetical protein